MEPTAEHTNEQPTSHKKKGKTVSLKTMVLAGILIAVVAFVAGTRSTGVIASLAGKPAGQLDFSSVQSLYETLANKYDGTLDAQKLIDGAKHGMVSATGDQYTEYFNAEEASEFMNDLEGTFSGIGAELGKQNEQLVIMSVIDNSPAAKSGLRATDKIVAVNDQPSSDWSIEKAVSEIRGEKGTTVKLTIVRGEEAPRDLTITRDTITDPSVKSEITADNIGILRISRFGESDTTRLARAAAEQFREKNVKGVIVDLRGNGGGYLSAAQNLAGIWLDNKVVVTERKGGNVTDTLRSGDNPILEGVPTVVLINGGSASASEILAGALKDNNAAQLVGEKSFGKGSVQTIEDLSDGGKLKVTVAKWYTPNGKNISKEGITPETIVGFTEEDAAANRDPQKDKALELLR